MPKEDKQIKLFDSPEWWEEHWQGMPEYVQEDRMPWKTLPVHFKNENDLNLFSKLVGKKITKKSRCLWYPDVEIRHYMNKRYINKMFSSKGKKK